MRHILDTSSCRKSTELLWDGGETSTPADGEDRSAEVREPTPPPKAEAVVEPTFQEATLVEGKCPVTTNSHHA
jgi:hypothetical protein